jgi:hypothetical protein
MGGSLGVLADDGRKLAKLQRALGGFVFAWLSMGTASRPTDETGTLGSCVSLYGGDIVVLV